MTENEREVAPLLDLLNLESPGVLIDLPREERRQILSRFDRPRRPSADPGALYPRLLGRGETVLEPQGRIIEAAVLYALAQDDCLEGGDEFAGLAILFRFKLGHALHLLDETSEANLRKCIGFATRTVALLKEAKASGRVDRDTCRGFMHKLLHWLGFRYDELGERQLAIDCLLRASSEADEPCDRIDCLLKIASIHEDQGEDQEAYRWLLQCRKDLALVEDEEIREVWEMHAGVLQMKLGGHLLPLAKSFRTSVAQGFSEMLGKGLTQEEAPNFQRLDSLLTMLPMPDEQGDADLRHAFLLGQAKTAIALEQSDRARQLVDAAERLESRLTLEKARFQREVLLARKEVQSGEPAAAVRLLAALLPKAEVQLDANGQITFLAHLLEAMAKESLPNIQEIRTRTTQLLALFDQLLEQQPGGAARRRVRDLQQRSLESALFALLAAAGKSSFRQEMLTRAWKLIMATRNSELRTASSEARGRTDGDIRRLEKEFHAALREQLKGFINKRPACWEGPLDRLLECEIAIVRAPRSPDSAFFAPPSRGVGLAFFRFRDLFRDQPMLALISLNGGLLCRWVPGDVLEEREDELPIWSWLPEDLVEIARVPGKNPLPWSFFPDAQLHQTQVEMVSFSEEERLYLGEAVPVQLCLRSSVPDATARVELSRGWVGLGGVPSFGIFMPELRAAAEEVAQVRDLLASRDLPTSLLLGRDGTVARLSSCLARLHPAVVHIAVHGHSEEDHPDACALILAPDPEDGGYELLPFRRILDLPLRGVELVVLSACSSLLGPSRRSAGMEGLAWAFLEAGAKQVIATRGEANDRETFHIMSALYHHLLEHPVAEALRRTRRECLRDLGIDPNEVSLWSVWS